MTEPTMSATIDAPFEHTLARVRELLGTAGFGVLTEIDLAATLTAKLGVQLMPKVILGACRPELAYRALQADPRIAALLPCNVVVSALGDQSLVEVLDPAVMTSFVDGPALDTVADDARERLEGMLAALTKKGPDSDAASS